MILNKLGNKFVRSQKTFIHMFCSNSYKTHINMKKKKNKLYVYVNFQCENYSFTDKFSAQITYFYILFHFHFFPSFLSFPPILLFDFFHFHSMVFPFITVRHLYTGCSIINVFFFSFKFIIKLFYTITSLYIACKFSFSLFFFI